MLAERLREAPGEPVEHGAALLAARDQSSGAQEAECVADRVLADL
jgi:hypothetical protein